MSAATITALCILSALILGAVGAWAGNTKGRPTAGFWLGFFFGPLGWITVLLTDRAEPAKPTQPEPTKTGPDTSETRTAEQILAQMDADLRAARESMEAARAPKI